MYFQALMMIGQAYAARRNQKVRNAGGQPGRISSNAGNVASTTSRLAELKGQADKNQNRYDNILNNDAFKDKSYGNEIQKHERFIDESKFY